MKSLLRGLTAVFFASALMVYGFHAVKDSLLKEGVIWFFRTHAGVRMEIEHAGADFSGGAMQLRNVSVYGGDGSFIHFPRIHARFNTLRLLSGRFEASIMHMDVDALKGVPRLRTSPDGGGRVRIKDLCLRFYEGALDAGDGGASVFLHEHHPDVKGIAAVQTILAGAYSDMEKVHEAVQAGLENAQVEDSKGVEPALLQTRGGGPAGLNQPGEWPSPAGMMKSTVNPNAAIRK